MKRIGAVLASLTAALLAVLIAVPGQGKQAVDTLQRMEVRGLFVEGYKTNLQNVFGKKGETRFRIRAYYPERDKSGVSYVWRHFIDDPIEAERFWRVIHDAYVGGKAWPILECGCPDPRMTGLAYDFKSITFLTETTNRALLSTTTFLTTTGTNNYTTPGDWNNANNSIDCIAGGVVNVGAGYSQAVNQTISGSVSYTVATGSTATSPGSSAEPTFFGNAVFASSLCGAYNGTNNSINGVGSTRRDGGTQGLGNRGGGGAAGPLGNGASGGSSVNPDSSGGGGGGNGGGSNGVAGDAPAANGGNGGDNQGGTGHGSGATYGISPATDGTSGGGGGGAVLAFTTGGKGSLGVEYDATHGSGGGGGGCAKISNVNTGIGGEGGLYGGSGGACNSGGTNGTGKQGLIVVVYTPGGAAVYRRGLLLSIGP